MKKHIALMIVAAALGFVAAPAVGQEIKDAAAMAKAMAAATVKLDQGIKASAAQGTPISAKYELDEKGALQLSVYTMKAGAPANAQFSEVIVDYAKGTVSKTETITDTGDLKHAADQSAAMAKAKTTLEQAAAKAATDNAGYTVVAVIPALQGANPVADVTLMKGTEVKKASVKLD